jgi:hypothetical protein
LLAVPDEDVDIAEDVCAQDAESLGPENCFGFEGMVGAERCQLVQNLVTDCFDDQHVCDKLLGAVFECFPIIDPEASESFERAECVADPCEGPLGQGCAEWVADCGGGGAACARVAVVLRLLDQVIAAVCGDNNEQCSI